ncbi:prolipoprotein diacylglyceryl transferase [Nocardia aurantia]|uniref:Mce-associated membrane protein n=1 Tax=Nocardia aurantia TaxID=2585199 RepID=A0A7K0DJ63_9NOCA|nr:hypothetical protein [Nocardia aurantia]MQY25850.1 hypothetical protein [Nocardia aurantia]
MSDREVAPPSSDGPDRAAVDTAAEPSDRTVSERADATTDRSADAASVGPAATATIHGDSTAARTPDPAVPQPDSVTIPQPAASGTPAPGGSAVAKSAAGDSKSRTLRITVPAPGRAGRLVIQAVVLLALVAATVSTVFFYHRDHQQHELAVAERDARTAACAYAPVLANYDAKNLDSYFAAVLAGATGDWHKQFDATSKDLRDVLTQGQVVSKATDVQCGIRTSDRDSAEAVVVIGQTITSLGTQGKPAPGQLSMVMRLQRTGGHWLVDKVNSPLAQPSQP